MHQIVSELVEEEETTRTYEFDPGERRVAHRGGLATSEGPSEDVVDYDIDMYAERLDEILSTKIACTQNFTTI